MDVVRASPRRWPVFSSSAFPSLDLLSAGTEAEVETVIERDFGAKAPSAIDIRDRVLGGGYATRFDLLRDVVRHLYWTHRYFLTLYWLRPCRWEEAQGTVGDSRLPLFESSTGAAELAEVVARALPRLSSRWAGDGEERVADLLHGPLVSGIFDPEPLTAALPTVGCAIARQAALAMRVPGFRLLAGIARDDVLALDDPEPETTALLRQAGVMASEHVGRWGPPSLAPLADLDLTDYVLLAWPRSPDVSNLLAADRSPRSRALPVTTRSRDRHHRLTYKPVGGVTIDAIAAVTGELRVTNDDIVANAAWHWSPITSKEIYERTGIVERRYTELTLDQLAAAAAGRALSGKPDRVRDIGAVVACTVTNSQPIPPFATRVADLLSLTSLSSVWDVSAGCAGFPYGLALAARVVEEGKFNVLLVLAEKLSDKAGTVRNSRMVFGDGAAAVLLTPAQGRGDVDFVETYAGGTSEEVAAGMWPNPDFGNAVTFGRGIAASAVERFLRQILRDLGGFGADGDPLAGVDLVVPHQANERFVRDVAEAVGFPGELLYFNVARVGNTSCVSIPLAIADAVADGRIARPSRVATPAYAAGALAGVSVITVRPEAVMPMTEAPAIV